MNHKQRAKWEKVRAGGMWRYVLIYGVLYWGGVMIVGTSIYNFFFRPYRFSLNELKFSVPVFLVGGLLFGLFGWLVSEHQYRKDPGHRS